MSEYIYYIFAQKEIVFYTLQGLFKVSTSAISLLFRRPFFGLLHVLDQFCATNVLLQFLAVLAEPKKVSHLLEPTNVIKQVAAMRRSPNNKLSAITFTNTSIDDLPV